jgi:subtilase family serine protease
VSCSGGAFDAARTLPKTQPVMRLRPAIRALCPRATRPGEMECLALLRTDVSTAAPACNGEPPYCASDLQSAYNLGSAIGRGRGATIAIVDAFGYQAAATDLAIYRQTMKLPPCTTVSGCLRIVNQAGKSAPLPPQNLVWAAEQAIDLDMASAMCPQCKLVLVQSTQASIASFGAAENAAVALGANVVSNSYDGQESTATNPNFNHPGHVITVSAGDGGAGATQPCTFATVVCVGGTTLSPATNARGWSEVAWGDGLENGTGSGCSALVPKPVWQTDKGCTMRSETDISAVADPLAGVAVYNTGAHGWIEAGGTSVSSPIVAAIFALAGNAAKINAPQYVWTHGGTAAYNDIVKGHNPGDFQCPPAMRYICYAGPGYDGPTGWGTANGISGF